MPPVDLANGTATIEITKNGKPLKNVEVGIRFVVLPGPYDTVPLITKCCKRQCTDRDGRIDLNFKKGALNQVRIEVNLEVKGDGDACCCIRLQATLTPREEMSVTVLDYMALNDNWEEMKLYLMILRNNALAGDTSARDHSLSPPQQGGPCKASRALAMAQIAMADAYNAILNEFARYTPIEDFQGGDPRSAVAQANHDVLVALYSQQASALDVELTKFLDAVPNGDAKQIGIEAGKRAAELILQMRANDNSNLPDGVAPPYNILTNPGVWSEAPPEANAGGSVALGSQWGLVTPFTFQTSQIATLFRAPPPPALTSLEYVAAFNDVKAQGAVGNSANPTTRTQDQTEAGIYWGYDGSRELCAPPSAYFAISRHIMTQERATPATLMRILSLVGVGMAEAGITAWESKYFYNHWRPITALRYQGVVGVNAAAVSQIDWLCLGAPASNDSNNGINFVPNFPGYVSGHATFGGTVFQILRRHFQTDDIAFSFCSRELDGLTTSSSNTVRPFRPRSFIRLSQAEIENAESRIFLGIHFSYDRDAGIIQGNKVADWVIAHAFQPVE